MKALSKRNKQKHDQLISEMKSDQTRAGELQSRSTKMLEPGSEERLSELKSMAEPAVDAKAKALANDAQEILNKSEEKKSKFLSAHSSPASKQYQKRIALA